MPLTLIFQKNPSNEQGDTVDENISLPGNLTTGELIVTPIILDADFTDPTKSFSIVIESMSGDFFGSTGWVGDPAANPADPDQRPNLSVSIPPMVGKLLRVRRVVPVRMRLGWRVEHFVN